MVSRRKSLFHLLIYIRLYINVKLPFFEVVVVVVVVALVVVYLVCLIVFIRKGTAMFLNAGLTHDHVEVICAALHLVHEDELVQVFLICNELQTILLNLLLEEMFSTRADMVYWERFRKGSNWEILLSRMNSRVFNWVFPREDNIESLFQNPTDLIHYIESLRADFYSLAIFLAKVNHAGSYLKKIYNEIHKKSVFRHPTCATLVLAAKVLTVSTNQSCAPAASASRVDGERDHVNESNEELLTFSQKTVKDVVTQTHKLLREFLTEISQAIGDHMPQLSLFEQLPRCEKQELQQASISTLHIVSGTMMDMLLRHPCYDVRIECNFLNDIYLYSMYTFNPFNLVLLFVYSLRLFKCVSQRLL